MLLRAHAHMPGRRSNARPISACRATATVAVVQKPRKARDMGLPWYIPGFETRVRIPGVDLRLFIPGLQPGFATWPIPGFSRVVLLGVGWEQESLRAWTFGVLEVGPVVIV